LTVAETSTATSRQWFYGTSASGPYNNSISGATSTSYTPNFASQGTYYVVCISTFACGVITSNAVQINVSATITTGNISGSPFCASSTTGSAVSVPFTSAGTFASNTYTAQLSSSTGSFSSPVSIGTYPTNANSGTISATIPAGTAAGTGYLIRVISSSPSVTGSSSSALTVYVPSNSIAPTTTQTINTSTNGTTLTVTEASTPTSRQWYYSTASGGPYSNSISGATSTTYIPNFATAGTYYIVCVSTFPCATVTSNQVQVTVLTPSITLGTISGSPFCVTSSASASISIPFTSVGVFTSNTYTAQLSNASGSFGSPTTIGTLSSNANSGTISGTIPAGTAYGTGYLIRVISSGPSETSNTSSNQTIVLESNSIAPTTTQSYAAGVGGSALTVTEGTAVVSRQWYYGTASGGPYSNSISGATSTSYTPGFTTAGTYYVVCISTFACGSVTSNQVQVTVTPGALAVLTMSSISSPQQADESFSASTTITGKDAYGNLVNGGTVNFTTTAGTVTPASSTLSSSGTAAVTFKVTQSGSNQTITATSASNGSVFVLSNSFTVSTFADNSSGDYFRTNAAADWSAMSTWQGSHDGTNWYTATAVPTSTAASILVQNAITISTSISSSSLTISGGTININSGGNLSNSGTISGATTTTLLVNSGGTYTHALNGGTIPTATWNSSSTIIVSGVTSTAPSGLGQAFGNFTWSSVLSSNVNINSALTTVNGNFTFNANSPNYNFILADNSSLTLNVAGNFVVSGSGSTLILTEGNSSPVINVSGNFTLSNSSDLDFADGSGAAVLNLKGNYSASGASSLNESNSENGYLFGNAPNGTFNFAGASQTISNSATGDLSNVNFNINSGSVVTLGSNFAINNSTSYYGSIATLSVASGATLITGTYYINGTARVNGFGPTLQNSTFTINSSGDIQIGSIAGITASVSSGNVQTATRNFNGGSNYTYNGSSAQVTGNGLPAILTDSLTIANSTGVTLSQATAINTPGKLLLTTGTFTNGSSLSLGNGSTLIRDNGALSAAPTFTNTVNVSYSSLGPNTLTQTTGYELPASTTALGNLTINKAGANITLGAGATVNGVLYLTNGLLTTSASNLLVISSTGSANVASTTYSNPSYVNGPLQRTGTGSFTFPVGKSGTGYVPIGVSPTTSQTFTAEYIREGALSVGTNFVTGTSLNHISSCDYWNLDLGSAYPSSTNSTMSSGTATVTLYWNQNNPCGNTYVSNLSTLAIGHYNYTNGWDVIGLGGYTTSGNTTAGSISYAGATTFSPFALGSTSSTGNPLPIIIDFFNASKQTNHNHLTWQVECTVNYSSFEVERSYDGENFTGIQTIDADSNSCGLTISYDDYSSMGNKVYYRIRITDAEGNSVYTSVELITTASNGLELISVRPNPVQGNANLIISASSSQNVEISLLGIDGREYQRQVVQVMNGSNSISLNTVVLPKGIYFVRGIFANGQTNTIKFVKQ
jgi:predicted aspartyl protease